MDASYLYSSFYFRSLSSVSMRSRVQIVRRATARVGSIRDVVGDKEGGLEELDHPFQRGGLEVLVRGEGAVEEERGGVDDGYTTIQLSAQCIYGSDSSDHCNQRTISKTDLELDGRDDDDNNDNMS